MSEAEYALMLAGGSARLSALLNSYERLTGKLLAADANALWHSPISVVAHDTGDNSDGAPAFFFANACALTLFKMSARAFIGMPSHESAQLSERDERAAMLAKLEAADIVTGYSGIRIAADETRFQLIDAIIWNIRDDNGVLLGQAAAFDDFDFL